MAIRRVSTRFPNYRNYSDRKKVNEKILTFGEGLDFFDQQEYGKRTIKADYDMHLP
jgi:hypothetical protein